jgi:hypothetical protein
MQIIKNFPFGPQKETNTRDHWKLFWVITRSESKMHTFQNHSTTKLAKNKLTMQGFEVLMPRKSSWSHVPRPRRSTSLLYL